MESESRLRPRAKRDGSSDDRVNLYVAVPDRPLFRAAGEYATEHDVSLSSLIAAALEDYLRARGSWPKPEER